MGRLRGLKQGGEIELPARALVGRSDACWIRVSHSLTSKEHARIHWTGDEWVIRDLGSTNGTYVAGERLDPGTEHALRAGVQIAFGDPGEETYEMISDAAPGALARCLEDGVVVGAEHNLLVLPGDDNPELSIYQTANGDWHVENADGEVEAARNGQTLVADGRQWKLELPAPNDRTPIADNVVSLATTELRLRISKDQEQVEVALLNGPQSLDLGPRWYGYFLFVLAQARQEDTSAANADRGWLKMEEISRMLKLDSNAINVATHRARRELASLGLNDAAAIIEIKRGYRRLGTARVQIEQLSD